MQFDARITRIVKVQNVFACKYVGIKTEYWVTIYESHDSDLIIFVILFANSNDDTGLMW